jgi:carbon storage regulator
MGRLVITRRAMERVLVGSDIVVTMVRTEGNQARLMIEAPDDVLILRQELVGDRDSDRPGPEYKPKGGSRP